MTTSIELYFLLDILCDKKYKEKQKKNHITDL